MNTHTNYSISIYVEKDIAAVTKAIKNFRLWWSEQIEGSTDKLNEVFFYHFKDVHLCRMKLIEDSEKRIVYKVLENYFSFTESKSEWKDSALIFEINLKDKRTEIIFTHDGLNPKEECYDVCSDSWRHYIQDSLYQLLTIGKGQPNTIIKDGFNAEMVNKWKLLSSKF